MARTRWLIRPLLSGGGGYEVRRDRRVVRIVHSEDAALALVKAERGEEDRVYAEQADGYRLDITLDVGRSRRRRWREGL